MTLRHTVLPANPPDTQPPTDGRAPGKVVLPCAEP
jgi:hypothetical protein